MGEKALLQFHPGEQTPPVDKGRMRCFIVVLKGESTGRLSTTPLYYLRDYPLNFEEGCGAEDCEDTHEDGCPVTGWFYDESNFDCENCYYHASGEVLAWSELPSPDDALAALSRHGEGKP